MAGSSLLLSFGLENFRSFRDAATLTFARARRDENEAFRYPQVVPVLAVFGPNASGKTNLLRGLSTMFELIAGSTHMARGLPYTPFMLAGGRPKPTTFQLVALLEGVRYDYEFSYDGEAVLSETLSSYPHGRPRLLFERTVFEGEDRWSFGDSMTGPSQALARATRRHALLLSTASLMSHDVLTRVQEQMVALVESIGSDNFGEVLHRTVASIAENPRLAEMVESLLQVADVGVASLRIERSSMTDEMRAQLERLIAAVNPEMSADEMQDRFRYAPLEPTLRHHGDNGETFELPFDSESVGTRNFLALLGPVLAKLATGGVLIVDELDTSLHPRLVSELVRLFQSPLSNPHQAQLVLSTHDVTVMMNTGDYETLARDQIWFVEKKGGTSTIIPLVEFKPRANEVFSRAYLTGRYGALPRIDRHSFQDVWRHDSEGE